MSSILFLSLFTFACNNAVPSDHPDADTAAASATGSQGSAQDDEQTTPSGDSGQPDESEDYEDDTESSEEDPDEEIEPQDQDEDGFTDDLDCNDHDPRIYPGAAEFCDGIDTDCDGIVDPNSAVDALIWYRDADGDGFGDEADSKSACTDPGPVWVDNAEDCDDANDAVHPGAEEVCDGIDNDCDGVIDPDSSLDAGLWFSDADADGFGVAGEGTRGCVPPEGLWVDNAEDCDDASAAVHPGAEEMCDGIDSDCDGSEASGIATWNGGWMGREDVTDEMESGFFHRIEYGELKICSGAWNTRFEFELSGMVATLAPKVSIEGIGTVIIDGNDEGRLITVGHGVEQMELQGLTLREGSSDQGAALYAETLDLTLTDVRFSDNHSTGAGGAIYIEDGSIDMDSVDFLYNSSTGYGAHGGAVRLHTGNIEGSSVSFRHNEAAGMASGGAISVLEGSVVLEDSEFSQNQAAYKGGAVKLGAGDLTLLDSDASHNEALLGGAFYVGGSVDLVSTLISDNSANLGGGLFLDERDGSQTLTCDADGVTGSGFVENMAESKGGAVYLDQPIGTTWESSDCDWGTGSTDNGPADVGTPMFSFYASDEADFSCSGYWCSGSVSGELTTE